MRHTANFHQSTRSWMKETEILSWRYIKTFLPFVTRIVNISAKLEKDWYAIIVVGSKGEAKTQKTFDKKNAWEEKCRTKMIFAVFDKSFCPHSFMLKNCLCMKRSKFSNKGLNLFGISLTPYCSSTVKLFVRLARLLLRINPGIYPRVKR
jgi:hypothetical protein